MKSRRVLLTILFAIFFISWNIEARMFSNSSGTAFDTGSPINAVGAERVSYSQYNFIEELVIIGANSFFLANSDINSLTANIEVSDLYGADLSILSRYVNSSLENMYTARYYYRLLDYYSNQTSYNRIIIGKLLFFDYDSFQKQNGLLQDVFSEVKSYLIRGDVRGIYSRTSTNFDVIIRNLIAIKTELDAGRLPANNLLWNLNQNCAKTHMFGQYVARVFEALKQF